MGCHSSKEAAVHEAIQKVVEQQVEVAVKAANGDAPLDTLPEGPTLEALRLKALKDCRVLDTPAEERFDNITKLLQGVFQTPMALVSLIDSDRLVFHSIAGPAGPGGRRIHSFCDESLKAHNPTMMVVEDTLQDVRFIHSQFVEGPPHVRFYAGAPLVSSEGYVMGSLGILDLVPRKFPADMYNMICNFAELVVRELERDKVVELQRQRAAQLAQQHESLLRAMRHFEEAVIMCDLTSPDAWRIQYANAAWEKLTGASIESSLKSAFWDLLMLAPGANSTAEMAAAHLAVAAREPFTLRVRLRDGSSSRFVLLDFRPATNDHLSDGIPLIGIPNFVPPKAAEGGDGAHYKAAHYFAVAREIKPAPSPKDVLSARTSLDDSSRLSSAGTVGSRGSTGGSTHTCFGLDRPEELKDLKLGPMLGKGSFGKVYRGLWRGANVAVKVMDARVEAGSAEGGGDGQAAKGPLLEALLSREMTHPHVVATYEFASRIEEVPQQAAGDRAGGPADGQAAEGAEGAQEAPVQVQRIWIIQQYCNHGTLYDAIDRGWLRTKRDLDGPIDLLAVLQTAQEIASAMSFLHSRDILHCDLTGNNVLLTSSTNDERHFTALVCDFGLSRVLGDEPIRSTTVGTMSHMPVEAMLDGVVSKAVDVFSFGVLLFEMYAGHRAWCGQRAPQIVYLVGTLGQRLQLPPTAPEAYQALARECMSDDREARPSFDQILERLGGMLQEARGEAAAQHSTFGQVAL